MGHHVTCCLLLLQGLCLVTTAPVLPEPEVFKDDQLIVDTIHLAYNSLYQLSCRVPEVTMPHKLTMHIKINSRRKESPSPCVSSPRVSCSVTRDYFLYTKDTVEVTCIARYTDGTVRTAQRVTPEIIIAEGGEGAVQHNNQDSNTRKRAIGTDPLRSSARCREYRQAVKNRRVEAWAAGLKGGPGNNLTDQDLIEQINRARKQAAWKIMKLTKRHLCGEWREGENPRPSRGAAPHIHNVSHTTGTPTAAPSLTPQEQVYIQKSREVWGKLWEMFQTPDDWTLESGTEHSTPQQGCVHSRHFTDVGKVYRLQGYVDASPELLFHELITKFTDTPKWSDTLLECRVLQHLDGSTNILYTIAAEAGGGFISSRDFVNLNHYAPKDGVMVSSASAVTHPDMPVSGDHVRGESGPGGYIFKPVPGNPNRCLLIQIINTDLKGWIPQYVIDQALSGVLLQYLTDVQSHMAQVQDSSSQTP